MVVACETRSRARRLANLSPPLQTSATLFIEDGVGGSRHHLTMSQWNKHRMCMGAAFFWFCPRQINQHRFWVALCFRGWDVCFLPQRTKSVLQCHETSVRRCWVGQNAGCHNSSGRSWYSGMAHGCRVFGRRCMCVNILAVFCLGHRMPAVVETRQKPRRLMTPLLNAPDTLGRLCCRVHYRTWDVHPSLIV